MREKLAELAHSQWSGWMKYLFSKGTFNKDGTWIMPAWAVERWSHQMQTSYPQLSESEKESDREEADRVLEIIASQPVTQPDAIELMVAVEEAAQHCPDCVVGAFCSKHDKAFWEFWAEAKRHLSDNP